MLPTGFRTFHFVSFLYVFFFSFSFPFVSFLFSLFCFRFFTFRFFFRFFSLLFSLFSFSFFFSFRFFSFFSVSQFTGTLGFRRWGFIIFTCLNTLKISGYEFNLLSSQYSAFIFVLFELLFNRKRKRFYSSYDKSPYTHEKKTMRQHKDATKIFDYKRLRTDLGRSIGVTIATHLLLNQ